ncbi:calcyclin-binding protein-like [Clytia hemisphaerica]|uniref:SGS domain-containing protein n=1 Tax=Clytia hemisphaerica TaxID=252671 RepID=A0A7M5WQM0_9CNID
MKMTVRNHMDRHHVLHIQRLAHPINTTACTCKVKAGNIVIALRKAEDGQTWGGMTEAQRKDKEAKDNKFSSSTPSDANEDPQAGIMNLMKKMYDDGDDDMKRMIKKTWYESSQKQGGAGAGGMPGVPGMPGL